MSYAATVSFDIDNGESEDYDCIYAQLEKDGLSRSIEGQNKHKLPSTTLHGTFNGASASAVRDHVSDLVEAAFKHCKVSGKAFIATGGTDHTWAIRYPKSA